MNNQDITRPMLRNLDSIPTRNKVFIYGTGSAGKSLYMWLKKCRPDVRVLGFIDSCKKGRLAGLPIYLFTAFTSRFNPQHYDLILIASAANREIAKKLEEAGVRSFAIMVVSTYLMENLLPTPWTEIRQAAKIKLLAPFFSRHIHLFFGEHGGKFIGNNKYFFLFLKEMIPQDIFWVVEEEALAEELIEAGLPVLSFKSANITDYLFSAAYFYFDNMTWQRKYPWLRYFKAKIIHMSHGVGLKMTEKMLIPQAFTEALTPREKKQLDRKIFKNHLLVSTSEFYARNVSAPAYNTPLNRIIPSGYPKNDLFYRDIPGESIFTHQDTLNRVDEFIRQGYKVMVYAPTFRDMDSQYRFTDILDFEVFDRFLAEHRLVMVIKGHTSLAIRQDRQNHNPASLGHILFYANDRDGYPLLKRADLLITDYSSIYMDFLHRQKPVVFFTYDYREYIAYHREIQFDYQQMTPGPKAGNYEELIHWLNHFLVEGKDGFAGQREQILDLGFLNKDGFSCQRIYKILQIQEKSK